jgi:hypothetical protein
MDHEEGELRRPRAGPNLWRSNKRGFMSYMQIASEETIRAGRKIIEQYGSWSAAIAAGERREDGVVILPATPPATARDQTPEDAT